ncbi:MAG: AAA family ATPase, partial [Pikeienuella sp.]
METGDVRQWLAQQGLAQIAGVFEREQIDWEALFVLSEADLKDLGLPIGTRAKLSASLRALQGSKPTNGPLSSSHGDSKGPIGDGERRQLTTLFCDVVGYTELTQRIDPEHLQAAIRTFAEVCTTCISNYEGHVFQIMGDGVMAFFGYPHAHEKEAERAIHASLEIIELLAQREFRGIGKLNVRVGVATGMVVLTSAGTSPIGEAINLAARLQSIAEPGTVAVSDQVRQLAGPGFEYVDLGTKTLKGISEPVQIFNVAGERDAASFLIDSYNDGEDLVGRRQEITALATCWSDVVSGAGRVAVVSGETGIGKSRLLNFQSRLFEEQGAQILRFQCSRYHTHSFLWPAAKSIEQALSFSSGESADSQLDKLEDLIVTRHNLPIEDVRYIASTLSIPCDDRYGEIRMTSQKHREEILRAIVDVTTAIARAQPSVLLFEDVQWADSTSHEVINLLIEQAKNLPMLIVMTHRLDFDSRWPETKAVRSIKMERLSLAEGEALILQVTGGLPLPDDLKDRILAKADGVPLFAEEMTKAVLETGRLTIVDDRLEYSGGTHEISIPATLRDLLMERLDRFADAKKIAQIGSAIGRTFNYDLITAVMATTTAKLNTALDRLIEAGLATRSGTGSDANFTFKHALVHDTAYESMLKSRRQKLHASIALALETEFPTIITANPEVLARHLTLAGLAEASLPFWRRAGEQALGRLALSEAITHLNEGLRMVAKTPESIERDRHEIALRRGLGAAWMGSKGWAAQEAKESLLPALDLIGSAAATRDMLAVFWGIWSNTLSQGRVAESTEWTEALLRQGIEKDDQETEVIANLMLTVSKFWLGDLNACYAHADNVRSSYTSRTHGGIANEINHDPLTGAGIYRAQVSWMLGYPDRAVEEFNENVDHARNRGHRFDLGFALGAGADIFEYRGEHEKQREYIEECRQIGEDNRLSVLSDVVAPLRHGASLIRAGELDDGITWLRSHLAKREAAGSFGGSNIYLQTLVAEGLAHKNDLAAAQNVIDHQIAQIQRLGWGEQSHYAELRRIEGWVHELHGDFGAAEAGYRLSLDWAQAQNARSWELRTATSLAELLHQHDRTAEARTLLSPLYDWFTEGH